MNAWFPTSSTEHFSPRTTKLWASGISNDANPLAVIESLIRICHLVVRSIPDGPIFLSHSSISTFASSPISAAIAWSG